VTATVPVTRRAEDGVAWLGFNRPAQANAIDVPLATAFRDIVTDLAADSTCRVVVLSGDARFFSAGGDVRAMISASSPTEYLRELVDILHQGINILAESQLIVVAEVDGAAAGAGFSLVLNTDLAIASSNATFLTAYGAAGLTPDTGMSALLPQIVGPRRANELLFLGRKLDAATALDWGIINEVVPAGALRERVIAVATAIAHGPFPALAETKRLLRSGRSVGYKDQLADEADTIVAAIGSDAARERIGAFTQRSSSDSTQS
jgi:2-(1,2-epoxy-1,2-dihydrophenyl)acetyl-CoA isomerase